MKWHRNNGEMMTKDRNYDGNRQTRVTKNEIMYMNYEKMGSSKSQHLDGSGVAVWGLILLQHLYSALIEVILRDYLLPSTLN